MRTAANRASGAAGESCPQWEEAALGMSAAPRPVLLLAWPRLGGDKG